jgi:DNA-binding FadR family transcriptional regulator
MTNKTIAAIGSTNTRLDARVLQQLRRYVAEAKKTDDKKLPPERDLARALGLSRTVLRQALESLESEGLIWRHVGKGTFVGRRPSAELHQLQLRDLQSTTSPNEVMEARLSIEPKLAYVASLRATPAEIAEMERILQKASSTTEVPKYEHWDGSFHRAIAEASRNSLLLTFFNVLNATREQSFWGQLKERRLKPSRIAVYNDQHRLILNGIRERDPARAESAMTAHLQTVQRDLQE